MPTFTFTREIEDANGDWAEVSFEAEYTITGSYSPATYWEPAEYPEVELIGAREVETGSAVEITDEEFDELQQYALRNDDRDDCDADYRRDLRMERV